MRCRNPSSALCSRWRPGGQDVAARTRRRGASTSTLSESGFGLPYALIARCMTPCYASVRLMPIQSA